MAVVTGLLGAVTSWAGTDNAAILTGTKPMDFTLNYASPDLETTAFADAGIETHIPDITDWSGSFTAQLATPAHGALGLVTFSSYAVNLDKWTLNATQAEHKVSAFGATAAAYIPGKVGWSGSFGGFGDGTTAVAPPGAAAAAVTLRYQDLATDAELAGNIFATQLGVTVGPGAPIGVQYAFRGTAGLTSTGTAKAFNTLALTPAGSLVLTATTSRTYTGSAFWTSLSIDCAVGKPTTLSVSFRGTGALTIA